MIDTINIRFKFDEYAKALECISIIEDNFGKGDKTRNWENDLLASYTNYIQNLKIRIDPSYMYIDGSLCKFYFGNNVQTLSMEQIKTAYSNLIYIFNGVIDLNEAIHKRLDISVNISTERNFSIYANSIIKSKRKDKSYYHSGTDTIYIGNKSQKFKIYDKTKDYEQGLEKNRKLFNTEKAEVNTLLRIEYEIHKEHVFRKLLGSSKPTIKQILDNVKVIPKIWFDEYNKLDKVDVSGLDTCKCNSTDDIRSYALLKAGIEDIQNYAEMNWKEGNITYAEKRTICTNWLDEALKFGEKNAIQNSPMQELGKKINQFYKNYINQ